MHAIDTRPLTKATWDDFVRFFEAKGSPHYCWCTAYRVSGHAGLSSAQKKAAMRRLVDAGTPVGLLAYDGDQPVGWCSIAPRETYVRLERSRTMPRATPPETPTWTVLCFFVARARRQQGITRALLEGAVAYARERGARVVEGYPFDAAGVSATHRGPSRVFQAARFRPDGNRWFRTTGVAGPRERDG